jgi:hypothetical protein
VREALQVGAILLLDAGDMVQAREWIDALSRWLEWSGAIRGQSACHALWAHYCRQIGHHVAYVDAEGWKQARGRTWREVMAHAFVVIAMWLAPTIPRERTATQAMTQA